RPRPAVPAAVRARDAAGRWVGEPEGIAIPSGNREGGSVVTVQEAMSKGGKEVPSVSRAQSMVREVGQSFYLMALMTLMLSVYVGLGLLAVRLFGKVDRPPHEPVLLREVVGFLGGRG